MAALRIYPDRYVAARRHIQLTSKAQLYNISSALLSLLSISPGLRNTEYRHIAKP